MDIKKTIMQANLPLLLSRPSIEAKVN